MACVFAYSYLVAAPKIDDDELEDFKALSRQEFKDKTHPLKVPNTDNEDVAAEPNRHTTDNSVAAGPFDMLTSTDFKVASLKQNQQQKRIQEAIVHSWKAYRSYSWGFDHLKPLSKSGHNWFKIGLTILDSLDTLIIAGLDKG